MKFKLSGSSTGSKDAGASPPSRQQETSARSDVGASAGSPPGGQTRGVPVRSMEEVPTTQTSASAGGRSGTNRLSAEILTSPRNGRPNLNRVETAASDDAGSYAFQVPETPPRGSNLGKHFMDTTKFSLTGSPSHSTSQKPSPPPTPFPLADDDSTRHVICQDSLAPWTYLLALPGKNVRDTLIDAFNDWLRCAPANLSLIKQIVGYLHTGSLIIDDIEDESATRRGEPAAHIVFGVARALNAGNYVYFLAMEKVLKLQSTECLTIFTAEMLNLHRGQGRDIFWRTTSYIASEEEYRQMVCDKTGGLFRLAIRFLQALSPLVESRMASSSSFEDEVPSTGGRHRRIVSASVFTASSDFTVLADQLACYFQVRDDLINLASPKFHMKKGFCEDITEGKLSFIALHSLRSYRATGKKAKMDELLSLLQSKSEDKKTIKRALALMDDTASFEHTVKYLKHLFADIESSIASLGRNPRLSDLLKTIAGEVDDCHDVRKRVIEAA